MAFFSEMCPMATKVNNNLRMVFWPTTWRHIFFTTYDEEAKLPTAGIVKAYCLNMYGFSRYCCQTQPLNKVFGKLLAEHLQGNWGRQTTSHTLGLQDLLRQSTAAVVLNVPCIFCIARWSLKCLERAEQVQPGATSQSLLDDFMLYANGMKPIRPNEMFLFQVFGSAKMSLRRIGTCLYASFRAVGLEAYVSQWVLGRTPKRRIQYRTVRP